MILTPIVLLGLGCAHDQLLERRFLAVTRDQSEAEILEIFGTPRRVNGPPQNVSWGSDASIRPNNGECVKEFSYLPMINVVDEDYVIGFDASGKVVSKYHYISQ